MTKGLFKAVLLIVLVTTFLVSCEEQRSESIDTAPVHEAGNHDAACTSTLIADSISDAIKRLDDASVSRCENIAAPCYVIPVKSCVRDGRVYEVYMNNPAYAYRHWSARQAETMPEPDYSGNFISQILFKTIYEQSDHEDMSLEEFMQPHFDQIDVCSEFIGPNTHQDSLTGVRDIESMIEIYFKFEAENSMEPC